MTLPLKATIVDQRELIYFAKMTFTAKRKDLSSVMYYVQLCNLVYYIAVCFFNIHLLT